MSILKVENVVKRFRDTVAVNGISFEVEKATIFGMLGPNGAGKTTLIRIITGIFHADEGDIYLDGKKIKGQTPRHIGYLPEERGLYKKMKVGEQLLYLTQLKGLSYKEAKQSIVSWMKKFEITDWWNKKVDELSKGMQQKVQFIATVAHNPELIILDEPFTGLDPVNTELIKKEIMTMRDKGVTVIFSTHRMEQVEEICEDIILINKGQLILQGKVPEIKEKYRENKYIVEFYHRPDLKELQDLDIVSSSGNTITLKLKEGMTSNDILAYFINKGIEIKAFKEVLPSLNDIFIKLVTEPEK